MSVIVELPLDLLAKVREQAERVCAHYRGNGDDPNAMPWTMHLLSDDELRQWLASREEAGRTIDIETCEIGWWYTQDFDVYGVLQVLGKEVIDSTCKTIFVRSPDSRGWVAEDDLPPIKSGELYDRIDREHEKKSQEARDPNQ